MRTKGIIAVVFTALLLSLAIVPVAMASDLEAEWRRPPGAVGGSIVLSPASAVNPVGTSHTVTATVRNYAGAPVEGVTVTFSITSGPNADQSGTDATDSNGEATWTYSSEEEGTDTIQACFNPIVYSAQCTTPSRICSNEVTKTWQGSVPPVPELSTIVLFGIGLLMLGGLIVLVRRKASAV